MILLELKNKKYLEYDIKETKHILESFSKRYSEISRDDVYNSLINKIPLGINKTSHNTFKLIYDNPKKNTEDLYIIIAIDERKDILVITTYSNTKNRRLRHYER